MGDIGAAMVLCAGLGTRLRPLTDWLAKPLVPVGDRPVASHVAARIREALPSTRLVANVHHGAEAVSAWAVAEGVLVSHEGVLLGTAGGVAHAGRLLGEGDVLVWNGDILCALDVKALAFTHVAEAEVHAAVATLAVASRAQGEGTVGLAPDGRVVRLRGERFGEEARGADFLGIHVLGRALRAALPSEGCLVGDVYLPALRRGAFVATHDAAAPFVDIGTLAGYLAANRAWLDERGLSSWASPEAVVTAEITGSVIGAGARVEATCLRSVVWPGAVVSEPVADAVITPRGAVRG
jgi:mannose-1-phosphate guanylyltransferase